MNNLNTRATTLDDVEAIFDIEKQAWGKSGASLKQIIQRIKIFPEGNPVCYVDNQIIGYGSTMIIPNLPENNFTWDQITSGGTCANHVDYGNIMYGVNASAIPGKHNNVLELLVEHCVGVGSKRSCKKLSLGSRVPGFRIWHQKNPEKSIEDYINIRTSSGKYIDWELELYHKGGFDIIRPLENYFPDESSMDWGVLVEMGI